MPITVKVVSEEAYDEWLDGDRGIRRQAARPDVARPTDNDRAGRGSPPGADRTTRAPQLLTRRPT
jgi:heme/copper-type cytochrome/quinol oxidase subunit 2